MDDAQTRTYTEALAVAATLPERERLAFAILTESNGYVWANDGTNSSQSPGVTSAISAVLRTSLSLPYDKVGSNGRSTGPLQQTSSDVGGAWGDMAGTMDPAESARRFLKVLNVTTVSQYVGILLTPSGSQRVVINLSDPIAADVLRVQQPLADEAQSSNYNAAQVQLARDIAARFSQPEEFIVATQADLEALLDQRFSKLVADIVEGVRNADIGGVPLAMALNTLATSRADETIETNEQVNQLTEWTKGGYTGSARDDNNIAGIWHMADDLVSRVTALKQQLAALTPPKPAA